MNSNVNVMFNFQSRVHHLIVNKEGTITVFQGGVRVEDGVVGLHYGRCYLWCWVDREGQLCFLWKVHLEDCDIFLGLI